MFRHSQALAGVTVIEERSLAEWRLHSMTTLFHVQI